MSKPKGNRHTWGIRGSRVGDESVIDFCTRGACNAARKWTPGAKGRRTGAIAWSPNGGATWQWESIPCQG